MHTLLTANVEYYLLLRLLITAPASYKCEKCGKSFRTETILARHTRAKHPGNSIIHFVIFFNY